MILLVEADFAGLPLHKRLPVLGFAAAISRDSCLK
jgi:hypothetical protein